MAKKKDVITSVPELVFKSIWLAIALLLYFVGMAIFLQDKTFGMWIAWGFVCAIPTLGDVIRSAVVEGRRGAVKGANTYTATVSSNSVTVQNHPFREALIGILVSIFASLLAGPVVLALKILTIVIQIVFFVIALVKTKKASK